MTNKHSSTTCEKSISNQCDRIRPEIISDELMAVTIVFYAKVSMAHRWPCELAIGY